MCENEAEVEFSLRHQCSRAYSLSFLRENDIRFDERCPMYVDLIFNAAAYRASKSPHCLYRRLYRYNRSRTSITGRSGEAFISDSANALAVMGEWLETEKGAERDASIYVMFTVIVSMISRCTPEAFERLKAVLETKTVKTVIAEVRSDEFHTNPIKNEMLKSLLSRLRADDIGGAVRLIKSYGGRK